MIHSGWLLVMIVELSIIITFGSFLDQSRAEIIKVTSKSRIYVQVIVFSALDGSSMSECPVFSIVTWLCDSHWPDPSTPQWFWPARQSDLVPLLQLRGPEMWLSLRLVIVFWPELWWPGLPSCQRPPVGLQPSLSGGCCPAPWRVKLPSLWLRPLVPSFDCWHCFIWPNLIWSSLRRCATWRLFSSSRVVPLWLGPGTLVRVVCFKVIGSQSINCW